MSSDIRFRAVRKFDVERFIKALMAHLRELEASAKNTETEITDPDSAEGNA